MVTSVTTERACVNCAHSEHWTEHGEHMWDCQLATEALACMGKYRKHWEWREDVDDNDQGTVVGSICTHFDDVRKYHMPRPDKSCPTEEHW